MDMTDKLENRYMPTEPELRRLDTIGAVLAAVITLGPLVTAAFWV